MNPFIKKVAVPILITVYFFTSLPGSISFVLAEPGDETTYYFLTDHLGSVDVVLDEEGNVVERRDYLPYGQERYVHEELNAPQTDYGFTGKELDEETGLNYYDARYYDSEIGKFTSQDSLLLSLGSPDFFTQWEENQKGITLKLAYDNYRSQQFEDSKNAILQKYLSNPQRLNSYAYVLNNPLIFTDPSGEDEVHFSLTTNIGLGASAGTTLSVGFAFDGSYGVSISHHSGGFAGADASIGAQLGYSNAETWGDTAGENIYWEAGGKIGAGGGVSIDFSEEGIEGADIGVGIGPSLPVYQGAGISSSAVLIDRNIKEDFNTVRQGLSDAIDKTVDLVKGGMEKLTRTFKKKE